MNCSAFIRWWCAAPILLAAGGSYAGGPIATVNEFVRLDAEGGRLAKNAASRSLWRLVTQEAHDHDPGWDTANLIARYEVNGAASERETTWVSVTYAVLGVVYPDSNGWFHPVLHDTVVRVPTVRRGNRWLVAGTPGPPAIIPTTAARHMWILLGSDSRSPGMRAAASDLERCRVCEGKPLPISREEIAGKSRREVQIMRNTIYACRGRAFQTPWLAAYFNAQPWYRVNPAYGDSLISSEEQCRAQVLYLIEQSIGIRRDEHAGTNFE